MKNTIITFILIFTIGIDLFSQNSSGMPAGNIGIGTSSPATLLQVHQAAGTTTVGNEVEVLRVSGNHTNLTQFNFLFRRHTAGTDWLGVSSKLQFTTDNVKQGFIEFNPSGGDVGALAFGTDNAEAFRIKYNGLVGIGTIEPQTKLHVYGGNLGLNVDDKVKNLQVQNGCGSDLASIEFYTYRNTNGNSWLTASTRIQNSINGVNKGFIEFNPPGMLHGLALGTESQQRLFINETGQVGIGTSAINDNNYKLFVETGIRTRKIKVDLVSWPDYVFHPSYPLLPLSKLKQYIDTYHHLPEVLSAAEVKKDGLDLGDNQAMLLKKIEELTLYLIDQQKSIESLKKEIEQLKAARR